MANKYRVGQSATLEGEQVVITDVIHDEDDDFEATYEVTFADGSSIDAIDSELQNVV